MKKILLLFLLIALVVPFGYSHSDEYEESGMGSMHLFHYGKLSFPVWTYYAEIVEHVLLFTIAVAGVWLIYYKLYKSHEHLKEVLDYVLWGFALLGLGELLTTLHHFLIYPFGIFNAVINHGLVLVGIGLLIYSFFILRNKDMGVK